MSCAALFCVHDVYMILKMAVDQFLVFDWTVGSYQVNFL